MAANAPEQAFCFEAGTDATGAFGVAAVFGQEHTDVHLVGLGLEVFKKALDAIPLMLPLALPFRRTVDHPVLLALGQLVPGRVSRNACRLGVAHQVVLALFPGRCLDGLDGTRSQRELGVGNDQAVVHTDHAAKAPAGFASAHSGVKREHRRDRVGVTQVAVGAMQPRRETPKVKGRLCFSSSA